MPNRKGQKCMIIFIKPHPNACVQKPLEISDGPLFPRQDKPHGEMHQLWASAVSNPLIFLFENSMRNFIPIEFLHSK
jgi:hypothetical protein